MNNKKPYKSKLNSDEHIRGMFQDFKAPYDSDSWELLSQKLDSALPFVSLSDSEIREDLATVSVPFDSASWNVLEQRLDLLDTRKKWILRGKIVELTMFFFVFYFLSDSFNLPFEQNSGEIEIAINDSQTSSQNNLDSSTKDPVLKEVPNQQSLNQNITLNKSKKTTGSGVSEQVPATGKNVSELNKSNNSYSYRSGNSEFANQTSLQDSELDSDASALLPDNQNTSAETSLVTWTSDEILTHDEENVSKLPLIGLHIEQENPEQYDLLMPVLHPGNFNDRKFSFLVGAVIGYDKDLIKSPFPHQKSEVMLGRIEDNFRMGLNLSMDMNAFEISAGVHYLIKNYKSVYAGENQVRIANIPIMVKLKLPFAGFMRGYVAGGVSGNYVIHANYAEHDYFRDRPQLEYVENNARAAGYSLLSSTSYKNGIFEGETIRGNHFYTANIAIGLEAHLNKTYSLFFEQAYSHHLKGSAIGPAFDHFFSSTTLMGLRYRIFKNSNSVLHTNSGKSLR
jgi:hypothetical protein